LDYLELYIIQLDTVCAFGGSPSHNPSLLFHIYYL